MIPLYRDYLWRHGKPYGLGKVDHPVAEMEVYRIVSDPYQKWISIELYQGSHFVNSVYNSQFLDFRTLKPADQIGWRKQSIDDQTAWIFNEDDRLILKEISFYHHHLCIRTELYSPYQTLVGCYEMPEGPLGMVTLTDASRRIVMHRTYDVKRDKFVEKWDMREPHVPKNHEEDLRGRFIRS